MRRSLLPWRERLPAGLSRFEDEMEELMGRFFGDRGEWAISGFTPQANLAETDDAYEITMELPGLKPDEVVVELKEGGLWISGEKKEEKEEQGKTFHRLERRTGKFQRVIPLAGSVDEEKVLAKFEDGVLNIHVPKSEEVKPKKIRIQK